MRGADGRQAGGVFGRQSAAVAELQVGWSDVFVFRGLDYLFGLRIGVLSFSKKTKYVSFFPLNALTSKNSKRHVIIL